MTFGAKSVWVLDPPCKTLTLHHPDSPPRIWQANEAFEDPAVLPGFKIDPLSRVFE